VKDGIFSSSKLKSRIADMVKNLNPRTSFLYSQVQFLCDVYTNVLWASAQSAATG